MFDYHPLFYLFPTHTEAWKPNFIVLYKKNLILGYYTKNGYSRKLQIATNYFISIHMKIIFTI